MGGPISSRLHVSTSFTPSSPSPSTSTSPSSSSCGHQLWRCPSPRLDRLPHSTVRPRDFSTTRPSSSALLLRWCLRCAALHRTVGHRQLQPPSVPDPARPPRPSSSPVSTSVMSMSMSTSHGLQQPTQTTTHAGCIGRCMRRYTAAHPPELDLAFPMPFPLHPSRWPLLAPRRRGPATRQGSVPSRYRRRRARVACAGRGLKILNHSHSEHEMVDHPRSSSVCSFLTTLGACSSSRLPQTSACVSAAVELLLQATWRP